MEKYERTVSTADRLREAMRETGKTQADLVRETGIGKSNISRYITGRFDPKSDAVHKLAVALNVSEMWLWGCDVPKERPIETKKEQPTEYDGLSENRKALIDFVMSVSDAKAEKFLRLLQSIEEVDL